MNKPFLTGLVILSLILSGGGAVFGIPRVQAYLQANEHEKKGDNYFNQKQYEEALSAYKLSKERFSDRTIEDKISLSNQLSQDEGHYNNGNNAIEQESWGTAIKELSLVSQKSERYDAASKLVSYAIGKLGAQDKRETASETKTNTVKIAEQKESVVITSIPSTPSITPAPSVLQSAPETKPKVLENLDRLNTLEAERKTREAESCRRQTETYSNCTDDFNKSMSDYAACQSSNNEAIQTYNDKMEDYSRCVDEYNGKLEDYNECINPNSWQQQHSSLCFKPSNYCSKPFPVYSSYCNKPVNWCTKPYCY